MSSKQYIEAHREKMTKEQKDIMCDLYMSGINRDGHVWVKYGDVEDAVAAMFNLKKEGENGNN